jgi:phosphoribosylglycinamide formyltransferase-1
MTTLAIFASGAGSNAREIIRYFQGHPSIRVGLVGCNKPGAGVIDIAESAGIPVLLIDKERFFRGDACLGALQDAGIDYIILAGFLWKIPAALVDAYRGRILNIHPALLPKYGGKGMYGMHVHEAVIQAGEAESGITIHEVDERYDHGRHVFQARVPLDRHESPESLAGKIHLLEHAHFPRVIEAWVLTPRKG